jgi:hypothetical protein
MGATRHPTVHNSIADGVFSDQVVIGVIR